MHTRSKTVKTLAASAALVASLGLGAVLGSPGVAQAQEETTTTVVDDSTNATAATTDTTVRRQGHHRRYERFGPG